MKKIVLAICLLFLFAARLFAAQSVITEVDGSCCMGDDKSRKEAELVAVKDAKRKAAEYACTYISSETRIKDAAVEKDLVSAYANARVNVVKELEKAWYKEEGLGDCFRVKLRVEVIPDERVITAMSRKSSEVLESDPGAPLSVKVWTDRKEYRPGDRIRIYLKGNKPFYGRVLYKDAGGNVVQLLPNPFRDHNYFNGGVVYELPSGDDRFDLEVTPPFGTEGLTVYASTSQQGKLEVKAAGAVFEVKTKPADIAANTRGIALVSKGRGGSAAAEFSESAVELKTGN